MPKIIIIGGLPGSLVSFRGDLIKRWISAGLEVVAISAPAGKETINTLTKMGVKFKAIPLERDGLSIIKDLKFLFLLKKIIREEKPEYIFAYTVKPIIYTGLNLSKGTSIKFYAMITGLGYAFTGNSLKQKLLRNVLKYLYRPALGKSKAVIFQNPDDLALFQKMQIISDRNRAEVVNGSGVDTDFFNYSKPHQGKNIVFLMIGRLLKSKGVDDYAVAASMVRAKYKSVLFHLLGPLHESPDSIDRAELESWQEKGIIKYLGGHSDVRPYIEESSVYVLPSYREGTPRSVLEAMSIGRPIITTDVPGCRETVQQDINGFLVPVRDAEALAAAMEKFISNPDLITTMGLASRKLAEEKYQVGKVSNSILEIMGLRSVL